MPDRLAACPDNGPLLALLRPPAGVRILKLLPMGRCSDSGPCGAALALHINPDDWTCREPESRHRQQHAASHEASDAEAMLV